MSANRNSAHRRSLPVIPEHSQVITQRERLQVRDGSLNKGQHISSLGSPDHDSDRTCMLPTVVPRHSNESVDRLEAEDAPDQDDTPPRLPDDITRNKIEAMKIDRYQEKIPKLKGNKPSYNMSYQAGKNEVTRIPRKRGRSRSCSDRVNTLQTELEFNKGNGDVQIYLEKYDFKNVNETGQSVKLPNIFETQMPSARHCASASYAEIKHVQYANDDTNTSNLKKRRNQHYIGIPDTLLDKDLRLRVKDFLQKPQPKASTPSLRVKKIPDVQLEGKEKRNNYDSSLRKQFIGVPINTNSCPLMSHFKDRKWYYQDKSGKCRYLRAPESPVPPTRIEVSKFEHRSHQI